MFPVSLYHVLYRPTMFPVPAQGLHSTRRMPLAKTRSSRNPQTTVALNKESLLEIVLKGQVPLGHGLAAEVVPEELRRL